MTASKAYWLLDERIQRHIWLEGWDELRDVQERSIPIVLEGRQDLIISAATAAGKTEAAFLPALTSLVQGKAPGLIVYISPIKALINDQYARLERLCQALDIPVWAWHGDIGFSQKSKFMKTPYGVLLITPESIEAILCTKGSQSGTMFAGLSYFIVDELHAFIGSERGKQLQSLMYRIELAIGRSVMRVGLSATLGDPSLAACFLRPGKALDVAVVESTERHAPLHVIIKGYEEPFSRGEPSTTDSSTETPSRRRATQSINLDSMDVDENDELSRADQIDDAGEDEDDPPDTESSVSIAQDLFQTLRGSNNLVFPNSRREVERYTWQLRKLSQQHSVPNEFWPHHGSLSRETRYESEAALKQSERPATAICTNTLELGIDIGSVKSVAQIGPPPSVASLRQRLGRSGRRKGAPAILRGYVIEDQITSRSGLASMLRLGTVQFIAAVQLMVERWIEPPAAAGLHYSTLVQQLLSLIAQKGGVTPVAAYECLCGPMAPFNGVPKSDFVELLRHLAGNKLLMQDGNGELLHGAAAEPLVNHYTFYAAFAADDEYRIVNRGRTLGTLPINSMLTVGQRILFSGRTWRLDVIDDTNHVIQVSRARGGKPPLFQGGSGRVHTIIRQKMRELLAGDETPVFVNEQAAALLRQGRLTYKELGLSSNTILPQGSGMFVQTWLGDAANETIACLFRFHGLEAAAAGPGIEVRSMGITVDDLRQKIGQIAMLPAPPVVDLLSGANNLRQEKWDWTLPPKLLALSYASRNLQLSEATQWLADQLEPTPSSPPLIVSGSE